MHDQIDPLTILALIIAAVAGPRLAAVISPYAVIVIAATIGGAWSLGARATSGRFSAVWYFVRLLATALVITTSLAKIFGHWVPWVDAQYLIAPIALAIGAVGDRWRAVFSWAMGAAGRILERRLGGGPRP